MERWLDQAYGHCKRCAYRDIGSPKGPDWVHRTPHWSADWPVQRLAWWLPPPGLLEAVMAEPACIPYGHQEPDWRRWVPTYGRAGHGRGGPIPSSRIRWSQQ